MVNSLFDSNYTFSLFSFDDFKKFAWTVSRGFVFESILRCLFHVYEPTDARIGRFFGEKVDK